MALWWDADKKLWRYEFQINGKRHTGSAKTKGTARTEREAHKKREKEAAGKKTQTDTDFEMVANLYLDFSEKAHASDTYKQKARVLRWFKDFNGDCDIREITPQVIHEYLSTRPTAHNYNAHRKELSTLFEYAMKKLKIMNHSPVWDLDKLKEDQKPRKIPTQEEFLRILAAAKPETEKPLLLCLVHTWARIDELLRLTWKDVNFSERYVMLGTRKRMGGMEYDPIPMNEDLYAVLWSMWQKRKQEEWIFWNPKMESRFNHRPKMMHAICKRAEIKPIGKTTRRIRKGRKGKIESVEGNLYYGFHTIRHFMATYAKDKLKLPLGVISRLLRHRNLRTTEIYLHDMPGAVIEAMQKLEGIFENHTPEPHTMKIVKPVN